MARQLAAVAAPLIAAAVPGSAAAPRQSPSRMMPAATSRRCTPRPRRRREPGASDRAGHEAGAAGLRALSRDGRQDAAPGGTAPAPPSRPRRRDAPRQRLSTDGANLAGERLFAGHRADLARRRDFEDFDVVRGAQLVVLQAARDIDRAAGFA